MGTHLRVLGESYPMNTNMSGLRWFKRKKIHLRFIARFRFHILVVIPLALRAAKTGLTILFVFSSQKRFYQKIFEGEMFIRILLTTLLQIFCENLLYFQVIFKSMKIADDTFLGNSECEWVIGMWHLHSAGVFLLWRAHT